MICFDKKIIFIHIPRCAGESIKEYLKTISADWKDNYKHLKLYEYEYYYKINLKDYFIFTCVRNPYDRMFSLFRYLKNKLKYKRLETLKFSEWVLNMENKKSFEINPQSAFLLHENNYEVVFLKSENLRKDFNKNIIKHLGLEKHELNINNNLKKTKGYRLSDKMDDIIYNFYKIDFKSFKYKRGEGELIINDK